MCYKHSSFWVPIKECWHLAGLYLSAVLVLYFLAMTTYNQHPLRSDHNDPDTLSTVIHEHHLLS